MVEVHPRMHVSEHCTESTSTLCATCEEGTFQGDHNGREQCFGCKNCDAGLSLKEKKSCTATSDALCGPLDGYFCVDPGGGGCLAAQKHRVCSPGQHISQRGTTDKDTECLHCTNGTFSDGTSTSCQTHTKCEGLELIKPGSDSTDSECGKPSLHSGILVVIVLAVVVLVAIVTGAVIWRYNKKRKDNQPTEISVDTSDEVGVRFTSAQTSPQCHGSGSTVVE
ncbi:hypothetical protein NHX12_012228 [Muraenolepis orangiensis]|uniref:TNFR-Cys domain-containing protein n=1 Tax=Muraenolepis orangiensis TaxID=630683 RepID=A0A9Q0I4P7_9TELE|nr:hypothetical protein NHX12_012228 [Muraenolepis orangiensis]